MYGFFTKFQGSFEQALTEVTSRLAEEGFGVLTEINVKATLKTKLNIDKRPYTILGACNPQLANQALEVEPDIGLLLPCNVIVREEDDDSITVGFMDPEAVLGSADNPALATLATDVQTRLRRVCERIAGPSKTA